MQVNKILCALDLSGLSKTVVDYASMFAKMTGAEIHVVYIAPTMAQYTGFHVAPNTIDTFVGEIVTGAENTMEKYIADHFQDCNVTSEISVGIAHEEILRIANAASVDMIIMGTHGRKGFDRILFGSVAEKVIVQADVPVVTIRPGCPEVVYGK